MNDDMIANLLNRLQRLENTAPEVRKGVVTAISPLTVTLGGNTTPYPGVKSLGGTPLAIGDAVNVLTYGGGRVVLGVIGIATTYYAEVNTQQNTTSNAYVDLATDGPSLTLPSGNYVITGGATIYISAGTPVSFLGIYVQGALARQMQNNLAGISQIHHPSSAIRALALPAGAVAKLRYGAFGGCTAEFYNRWIRADRI